jgi:Prolyl oligopeptidase family
VARVQSPVLLLVGLKDRQTNVGSVQEFQHALSATGKVVDAEYYAEGQHVVSLSEPTADDATQRIIDFLHHYLSYRKSQAFGRINVTDAHGRGADGARVRLPVRTTPGYGVPRTCDRH